MAENITDQADEPGAAAESHPIGCHALVPWVASDAPLDQVDESGVDESGEACPADGDACAPGAPFTADEDEEMSVATSLRLHLMSEHDLPASLSLAEEEALLAHRREHADRGQEHGIADLRFRPGRALAGMRAGFESEAAEPPAQQRSRV